MQRSKKRSAHIYGINVLWLPTVQERKCAHDSLFCCKKCLTSQKLKSYFATFLKRLVFFWIHHQQGLEIITVMDKFGFNFSRKIILPPSLQPFKQYPWITTKNKRGTLAKKPNPTENKVLFICLVQELLHKDSIFHRI